MILPCIGSLREVCNLYGFQRRLESPHNSLTICHSSEGWNLPILNTYIAYACLSSVLNYSCGLNKFKYQL